MRERGFGVHKIACSTFYMCHKVWLLFYPKIHDNNDPIKLFLNRLQSLEKRILTEAAETPVIVYEMKRQVEGNRKIKILCCCRQWEDAEIMVLLQVMYTDLDFISTFNIELDVLQQFLYEVYRRYNNIPFHNFKHCFCVTQMMYGLIWLTDLRSEMDSIDLLIMLTSAVCHDLDHTGYNNAYQINARTELALRYNDISPLENHHCAVAFEILEKTESNIFRNLSTEQFKRIREGIIKCILATDMTRHTEILNKFKAILPVFDFSDKDHRDVLMMIMIKVSDISNEARPMDVAEPWLDCLLQEFFNQSDMEKLEGLPVTPFMDRDKVTKPSSQTGFIRFVLFPLFTELANLFPCLEVRKFPEENLSLEREKQNWTQSEKMVKPSNLKEPEAHPEPGGMTKPVNL
uniref:High affinity cGMP-specific 3',5'-cyclic phosphodiesterase 9A n=1 Tax=Sinocyclocheilus anshuiensis TaxID=1608454 RepID=A0A671MDG8_9TELE